MTLPAVRERRTAFSRDMVAAIRAGRKTVTRRIINPQPTSISDHSGRPLDDSRSEVIDCPFGLNRLVWPPEPGLLLVPITTWAVPAAFDGLRPSSLESDVPMWSAWLGDEPPRLLGKLRPGRLLPKTLEFHLPRLPVVSITLERLQEITAEDILAEGFEVPAALDAAACEYLPLSCSPTAVTPEIALRAVFAAGWDAMHGQGSWDHNRWVWRVEFRRGMPKWRSWVELPLKLVSLANQREHWRTRSRRAREHRTVARAMVRDLGRHPPCVVTITRIAPRQLDDDNLRGAAKSVRDGIADALGVDDADPSVEWRYGQGRGAPHQHAVRVDLEASDA